MYVEFRSSVLCLDSTILRLSLSDDDVLCSSSGVSSVVLKFAIFGCGCSSGDDISLGFLFDAVELVSSSDDNPVSEDSVF